MRKRILALCLAVYICVCCNTYAKKIKIVFINPGHPVSDATGEFWSNVTRFMQAASQDLNIELVTLFANRDHLLMKELALQVNQHEPDYAIIVNEKGVGVSLAQTLSENNIPSFFLLNNLAPAEFSTLTRKQQNLIIGSLTPNNRLAGKKLMSDLLYLHQQKHNIQKPIQVLALQGDYRSAAATERYKGLIEFLDNVEVNLLDSPVANWSRDEAYQKVKGLLQREKIDIIWAANDPMAIGASQAVYESNLHYPVTIGGINWDKHDELYSIDVSYGGHVTLGAKAIAMIADYENDTVKNCNMELVLDIFISSNGSNQEQFLQSTTPENIGLIDFKQYSKGTEQYIPFSMESFIYKDYTPLILESDRGQCFR